jgi:GNAT superfamily N-acetyltransferase
MDRTTSPTPLLIAAPDHPALDAALARFADELRGESRYFGQRGRESRKPSPSLVRRLVTPVPGVRLAAVVDGRIVGLARVDAAAADGPDLLIALVADWRGRGLARMLTTEVLERASASGYPRLVLHSSRRSPALRALAHALGFEVVDLGRGRLDLIVRWQAGARSA